MFARRYRWYRRYGDIPGVVYDTPVEIAPHALPGYGREPTTARYGELDWGGGDRRTPAARHGRSDYRRDRGLTSRELVQRTLEALELPGTASDYHFLLVAALESLWSRRRRDFEVIASVERFCLLDIELREALPGEFVAWPSYSRLAEIYEAEGFLHEAYELAERAGLHHQHTKLLAARLQAIADDDT